MDDEVCRRTALHYCAIEGNVEASAAGQRGGLTLGHCEVAEALLQAGADVFFRDREEPLRS